MKNPSYPKPGEIEKVIAQLEHLRGLREKLAEINRTLIENQKELRRRLVQFLDVWDDNNKPLEHYLKLYQRTGARGDRDIAELKVTEEALSKDYDTLHAEIKRLFPDIRAKALYLIAAAAQVKRAEYEELVARITAVLLPFYDNDAEAAAETARLTPAVYAIGLQRDRVSPSRYEVNETIIPLRAALEFATANTSKNEQK